MKKILSIPNSDATGTIEAIDMAIEALKQVTGKLNNSDDSLLTADPEACKEQKSKLDLISRQAAISHVDDVPYIKEHPNVGLLWKAWIESLPSAQPEIIRCKDCKWYGRVDKRRFYRGMDCLQKHIDTIVPDRDFCSKAERRTDEQ